MNATDEAGIHQSVHVHFDMDLKAAWRHRVRSLHCSMPHSCS